MRGEVVYRLPYVSTAKNAHRQEIHLRGPEVAVTARAFDPDPPAEQIDSGGVRGVWEATLDVAYGQQCHELDQWRCRGKVYEVVGDPVQHRSPFTGREFGTEIRLRRVRG